MFNKIRSILSGWFNYFFQREKVERIASERAAICGKCPYARASLVDVVWDSKNTMIAGKECSLCGCVLPAKVRSLEESCPDSPERWSAVK